jgi:quercetin dioxygenase-like cupin family protein
MQVFRIEDMRGGWFIGDFEPSVFRTVEVEVAYHRYTKGQEWPRHYHKTATEVNYMISGTMRLGGQRVTKGDVFVIPPGESVKPEYLEDCEVVVVKIPSSPGDKYEE